MLRYGPVQVECMSCSMDCDVISRLFRVCNLTRVSTTLVFFFFANPCFVSFRSVIDGKFHRAISQPQEGYLMVRQFQYLGWAGHREVPASKRSFLKLILQVDQWQREGEEGEGRTIVHCLWVRTPARPEGISPEIDGRMEALTFMLFVVVVPAGSGICQMFHISLLVLLLLLYYFFFFYFFPPVQQIILSNWIEGKLGDSYWFQKELKVTALHPILRWCLWVCKCLTFKKKSLIKISCPKPLATRGKISSRKAEVKLSPNIYSHDWYFHSTTSCNSQNTHREKVVICPKATVRAENEQIKVTINCAFHFFPSTHWLFCTIRVCDRNGGGRSGVFCASSIVCEMAKRQSVVDVFHAVKTLRNSKPNMVDTPVSR